MGLALLVFSVMAVFRTTETNPAVRHSRRCRCGGFSAHLEAAFEWNAFPEVVQNYLVPNHAFFGFFPWAAFVAFGMSAGSILRILKSEDVATAMQWFAWGGVALAFSAYAFSNLGISIYSNSDFWLNSPALIFIKLGAVLILIAFAWLWNLQTIPARELELGAPVRAHQPARLLGSCRAHLWALVWFFQGKPDRGSNRYCSRNYHRFNAWAFDASHKLGVSPCMDGA